MDIKIPLENHSRLLIPEIAEIPSQIQKNEELFKEYPKSERGMSLADLRTRMRERIKLLLDLDEKITPPIMVTAHQPGLWHPGILYKNAVAKAFAGKYFLLSINVDSDVVDAVSCKVPFADGPRLDFREKVILRNEDAKTFDMLPMPPKDDLDKTFTDIDGDLANLSDKSIIDSFRRFLAIHDEEYNRSKTISEWLTNCRKAYFAVPSMYELDISELCNTEEFRLFAWDILENCREFFEIYNSCLEKYRKEHKIKSRANPFPNLEHRSEDNIELPFWLITEDGRRQPLCVNCRTASILADHREVVRGLTANGDVSDIGNYQIRPKAVLLTMFLRMFVGTIFIHGVGGGNYDEFTDAVIRQYYGCEPPKYIVATKTEFLPLAGGSDDIEEKVKELKARIRNMKFNPDEYISSGNPLVAEKRELVGNSGRNTTKEEYGRLKQIRLELVKYIESEIAEQEEELGKLEHKLSMAASVRRRDFPYFFYPLNALEI